MTSHRIQILFLCTADGYRSQIAEGWANHLGGDFVFARSAGFAVRAPDPHVIAVMGETGVTSLQASVALTPERVRAADVVITLGDRRNAHYLTLPTHTRTRHWTLTDPAAAGGNDAARLRAFRAVRDDIRYRVANLIVELCANRRLLARGA
jgi:arsenate reductase